MRLLIDNKDLELLLEKKRDFIGKKVTVDTIVAGVSFLLSVFTANYEKIWEIPGIVLKTIFCMIGIVYCVKILYDVIDVYNNKYTHENLRKDIEKLDLIQHNHSLVLIRNTFDAEIKKFLVYYDENWDCKLFLNYKTVEKNNEAIIVDNIAADLGIDKIMVHCNYISSRVHEKYSVSHQENRVYNHRLYEAHISSFPDRMKKDNFIHNNKHYYWMTMEEMEKDENIIKKNVDVLDFVKEYIVKDWKYEY